MLGSILGLLTVVGMTTLLPAEVVLPESPAVVELVHPSHPVFAPKGCEDCHYCPWDPFYAIVGGGISMAQTDAEIISPEVCFFWDWCDGCDENEEEAPEEADSALSDLLYGDGMTVSEWMESNSSKFRFRTVDGTLEVASSNCGRVLTWVPLDDEDEASRIQAILGHR